MKKQSESEEKVIVVVNSEGYMNGKDSDIISGDNIFDQAYTSYAETFAELFDDGVDVDGTEKLTQTEFEAELDRTGYVYIQHYDYHIQYELHTKQRPKLSLSPDEREQVYREELARYTAGDVLTRMEEAFNDHDKLIKMSDAEKKKMADAIGGLWAYEGDYDCNNSYWDNIDNLIMDYLDE